MKASPSRAALWNALQSAHLIFGGRDQAQAASDTMGVQFYNLHFETKVFEAHLEKGSFHSIAFLFVMRIVCGGIW